MTSQYQRPSPLGMTRNSTFLAALLPPLSLPSPSMFHLPLCIPASSLPHFRRVDIAIVIGLRAAGFVEGQNIAIETRYAQKGPQQLPELAADLIRLKVDVIFA